MKLEDAVTGPYQLGRLFEMLSLKFPGFSWFGIHIMSQDGLLEMIIHMIIWIFVCLTGIVDLGYALGAYSWFCFNKLACQY